MARALWERPTGWDMTYLGYSWSDELGMKPAFHPYLRPTNTPAGTHAYAFSHRGVRKMYADLTDSGSLFSRPIDVSIPIFASSS